MRTTVIPTWSVLDRLIKAREVAGFSQSELAHQLGVSLSTVRRIEKGEKPANRMEIYGWGVACGVDPEWIIEGGDASADTAPDHLHDPSQGVLGLSYLADCVAA
jgi:transcriptional regulator with XRE-family HTH domain